MTATLDATKDAAEQKKVAEQAAERQRGILILVFLLVLLIADLILLILLNVPGIFSGNFAWVSATAPASGQTVAADAGTFGRGIITWLLAGFAGALVYLLGNVAQFMPAVSESKGKFRAYTPWYVATGVQGGIVAAVVMLFLTSVSLGLGQGIDVKFAALPSPLLTAVAFVLGFYGHVAKAQLDDTMSKLFKRAWLVAEGMNIVPRSAEVRFERQQQFAVEPPADVVWSASAGTINAAGLYTAPPKGSTPAGTRVQICASLRTDSTVSRTAYVKLVEPKDASGSGGQPALQDNVLPERAKHVHDRGKVDTVKENTPGEGAEEKEETGAGNGR